LWFERLAVSQQAVPDLTSGTNDVAAPGLKTPPQFGRIVLDDIGKAQIFDVAESLVAQDGGDLGRIEERQPWLAACRGALRHRSQAGAARRRLAFQRLGIVERDSRARNAGDEVERRRDGLACQVRRDTEPLEEGGPVMPKPRPRQSVGQALTFEIDGRQGQRVGYGESGLAQPLALPGLRCWKVHLEYANVGVRVAQRKGIEAGP